MATLPKDITPITLRQRIEAAVDTFPKLLRHNAQRFGDRVAFREKDLGIWRSITWREYFRRARAFGLGLVALGVERGEVLAIVGDNRPELFYAAVGAQSVGAITFGVYQDSLAEQMAQLVDFSDARFVFCENQEQADKILHTAGSVPKLQRIIVEDWRGMWQYHRPELISSADVERLGRARDAQEPDLFDRLIDTTHADDVAIFCQTSGTTGLPKLAMLSHHNLITQGMNFHAVERSLSPTDEFVSFLPFAWIGEQMLAATLHHLVGFTEIGRAHV